MFELVVTACITLSTQCFTAVISPPQAQVACTKEQLSLAGNEIITYTTESGESAEAFVYKLECVAKGSRV